MMYELGCVMSRHAHAKLQMDIRHTCVLVHYLFAVAVAIRAGADNWQLYMRTLCLQEHMYVKSGRTVSVREGKVPGHRSTKLFE